MRSRFISEGLENYLNKNHKVWHMPGHKRRAQFSEETALSRVLNQVMLYDVTEVPGTDDLYLAEDFLKNSLEQLRDIYHTAGSYYVVNGATGGIFTAISACAKAKDKVIMTRNCHKSVYNAVEILGLTPVYATTENIEDLCKKNQDAVAVIVTSPTYEGVIADITSICRVANENNMYVIVDEAHGAHLPFMEKVYGYDGNMLSAISQGADLVVQSTHKTLPAMTQTALLHVCNKTLVEQVERAWKRFLSSSPSYILMASTEEAVCYAEEFSFAEYLANLRAFRIKCKRNLKYLKLLERQDVLEDGGYEYDETRIVIYGKKDTGFLSGTVILNALEEAGNVVSEMAGENYLVLISTIADNREDFENLYDGLCEVDGLIDRGQLDICHENTAYSQEYILSLVGTKARDDIYVYPPGSYILTCGEEITNEHARRLIRYQQSGLRLRGTL